ncbi:MAG: ATP-binding cassette domain-containing protein [Pseudomonadota bacterium]
MLFQIRDLIKVYGNRTVLDIPELDFEKGIIYALVGPNGSGKTTLLELLSLLNHPTTGKVIYNNRPIDFSGSHLHTLRREIVLVQQNPVPFTTTVDKNLEFGLKIRGIPRKERDRIIKESLDLVGMGDFINAEAHKLSGGETQRMAIARAIACSPEVIMFDEPTTNVDMENQVAIESIITEINAWKKISIIFTTHNLMQASKLSHRVLSLYEGNLAPSTFENIYRGRVIPRDEGSTVCIIHEKVSIYMETMRTGNVKLSIDPKKVQILKDHDPPSGRNIFIGRLMLLSDEYGQVRATIDVGVPVNLLLPKEELKRTPLYLGEEIRIAIPKEAIRIV